MIWARPLGTQPPRSLLARTGLSPAEQALVVDGLDEVALLTGLDGEAREVLVSVAHEGWIAGAGDAALVRWSPPAVSRWISAGLPGELARALERLVAVRAPPPPLELAGQTLTWGERTFVMGIINVTPDSFSDGGALQTVDEAVARAKGLVEQGADLLDVGGESTRPGAAAVDETEELRRVMPVVERVAAELPRVPLSIDTRKPGVAVRALAAGAHLVNDVSGLEDPAMVEAVVQAGAAACAMHMRGEPATMQALAAYDDVGTAVLDALEARLAAAERLGLARSRVLVDPGLGFGKTAEHNLFLLRRLGDLRLLKSAVMVGASRKSFLGALVQKKPAPRRVVASAAAAAVVAAARGADVVRVHDVEETRDALAVADAVARARDGGTLFGGQ